MKRKTKEIASTARPKKKESPDLILMIPIEVSKEQLESIEKLAKKDRHEDPAEWAKKQILRIVADRGREIM